MKQKLRTGFLLLAAFALWTAALPVVDVEAIGPNGSKVGFAAMNRFVHNLTGVHMGLYTVTDWLGLVPLGFVLGFAILGLVQWIQRKQLQKVDRSILILGGFYLAMLAVFLFFEQTAINYRPVLIDGILEVSYPSSTTLLVMCVIPTTVIQLRSRIRRSLPRCCITILLSGFILFMVIGRLISGVHWFSDIIGGGLFSAGAVTVYNALCHAEKAE